MTVWAPIGLDRRADLDPALVDLRAAGLADRGGDVGGVTAPNRRPASPARAASCTGAASSRALTSLAVSRSAISRTSRARRIVSTCFSPPLVHADGEAARDEEVAAVAVLDLDDVTGGAEAGDLVGEDELHRASPSLSAPVEV